MSNLRHPVFARLYGRLAPMDERAGVGAHRDELLAGATGRVIEIGAGSGLCFSHYPDTVGEVMATEPEPHLRRLARRAADSAPVPVQIVDAPAEDLPFAPGSFDVAIASLVLCSVPDQQVALAEIRRVLRPGGQLRFYEHVRSRTPSKARLQDRVDPLWRRVLGGCHANRDTPAAIAQAGFAIDTCRRFEFHVGALSAPASPHVIGVGTVPVE